VEEIDVPRVGAPERPAAARRLDPPRVGVVLAAGRSERLRQVTGGGSKALVRLGGIGLVERAVRTLLDLGLERVVVVIGYHAGPVAAVVRRIAPGRVQVVEAADWAEGNGASLAAAEDALRGTPSFLLVTADHVFSEGALDPLLGGGEPSVLVDRTPDPGILGEATKAAIGPDGRVTALGKDVPTAVAECGAFVLPPDVFRAVRVRRRRGDASLSGAVTEVASRERVAPIPLPLGAWWQDVDTLEDLVRAGRLLRRSLPRATDGPVARLVNRRISVPISWALARFRPNPDLLSGIALLVGVASAVLLAAGEGVAGGVLAQAGSILDGVDGEVARLTLRAGPRGTLLDGVLDRLGDAAIVAALGIWAVGSGTPPTMAVVLVAAATAGAILSMATKDRVAALGLEPPSERRIGWVLGGRDGRLFLIGLFAILGQPVAALAVPAAASLLSSALRVLFARHAPA
jgi:choline kinase/phosphatidylglycerophosphate synthase